MDANLVVFSLEMTKAVSKERKKGGRNLVPIQEK